MSTVEKIIQTENQMTTQYNTSKFLHGDNKFIDANLTAAAGNGVLLEGMVMGKIGATGLLIPADKDATDGSQFPVGLCVITQTIADGETGTVRLVNKGIIDESKINFFDTETETLDTLIGAANNQRSYRDYMNDLGLSLRLATENTEFDN